jgi:hypothetical protein
VVPIDAGRFEDHRGYEAMNMIRKGQIRWLKGDTACQVRYLEQIIWNCCLTHQITIQLIRSNLFATDPSIQPPTPVIVSQLM